MTASKLASGPCLDLSDMGLRRQKPANEPSHAVNAYRSQGCFLIEGGVGAKLPQSSMRAMLDLPDPDPVLGLEIEFIAGRYMVDLIPPISIAHGIASIFSGRVRVGFQLLTQPDIGL